MQEMIESAGMDEVEPGYVAVTVDDIGFLSGHCSTDMLEGREDGLHLIRTMTHVVS